MLFSGSLRRIAAKRSSRKLAAPDFEGQITTNECVYAIRTSLQRREKPWKPRSTNRFAVKPRPEATTDYYNIPRGSPYPGCRSAGFVFTCIPVINQQGDENEWYSNGLEEECRTRVVGRIVLGDDDLVYVPHRVT
jgi:hypothetical protein